MRLLFSTAAAGDPSGFRVGMALLVVSAVLRPLFPLLFKVLVDGVLGHHVASVVLAAVGLGLVTAGGTAAGSYSSLYLWNVWERMTVTIDEQLVGMASRLGRVDRVERPEYLDHLTLVRTNRERFQESMMALLFSLSLALQVVITVVILAAIQPLLLLLPLFSAVPILASRWVESYVHGVRRRTAHLFRVANAFMMLAIDAAAAGELRVLRLRNFLIQRHRAEWWPMVRRRSRAQMFAVAVSAAAMLLFTLGFGGAVLLITVRSVRGSATLGSVVLVLTAGQQLHNQIAGVIGTAPDLFRVLELMREYAWLARYVDQNEDRGTLHAGQTLRHGIRLEQVSFRYPGSEDEAVHDVSLELPAGSVVALVGPNGAGKSTVVKLLCGLIGATSGRILVDGVDVADLDLPGWRTELSGAFQDFIRLEVVARESVGAGSVAQIESPAAVRQALRRSDVAELERELPHGLETPLGRAFLKGIDRSGGQWQKVALGRAMMRDGPLVLVLDEPTYSLDVESERRVFEWFARVAATENPIGTITVIVSHRFSTVRTASRIAVLDEGRLMEWGTHAELMAAGGRYATMYRTQAEGYR